MDITLRAGYTIGREYGRKVRQPAIGWGITYRGARSVCRIDYSWQDYAYQSTETSVGDHRISVTSYPRFSKTEVAEKEKMLSADQPSEMQNLGKNLTPVDRRSEEGMYTRAE